MTRGLFEAFIETLFPKRNDRYGRDSHPVVTSGKRLSQWPEGTLGNLLWKLKGRYMTVTVYNGPKGDEKKGLVHSPVLEKLSCDPRFGVHRDIWRYKLNEIADSVLERKVISYDIITDRLTDWQNLSPGCKGYWPRPESFYGSPGAYPFIKVYVEHRDESDMLGEFVYG